MNSREDQIRSIVAQSRALSKAEQSAYLAQACGDDQDLLEQVQRQLDTPEATASFDSAARHAQAASSSETPVPSEEVGSIIDGYKLLERIGEGGFGTVYAAEQFEPVRRRVALKLIKAGMDTKQVIARFEAERQALALMDHPNISRVFDAGTTDAGRPYFVMELVRGKPIGDYCDEHRLNPRQRLELFIQVCNAIRHAHEKGIIHRDIKPSNVLVASHDDQPAPKIIDFGVAKAMQQPLTEHTVYTAQDQWLGTPTYMSPEQAGGGGDVDARADIYSLGVLLYELLTSTTPFSREKFKGGSYEEIRRSIRDEEPPRPSTRITTLGERQTSVAKSRTTSPTSLKRMLRGDLDWIVLCCLEKDRSRRYKSVDELVADTRRHLDGAPIMAGPPNAIYRLGKFARRYRVGLIAAGCGIALLATAVYFGASIKNASQQQATEVERLADINLLGQLTDSQPRLLQLKYPQRRQKIDQWLREAEALASRQEGYAAQLKLRDGNEDLRSQQLRQLAASVKPFDELLQQVRAWAKLVPTAEQFESQWEQATAAIAAAHEGLRPARQSALYPLGADPRSKLWEFVDLNTGQAPTRDADGRNPVTAQTGIVYVLVPGGVSRLGSPPDEPGRKAGEQRYDALVSPLLISKYEVTQEQWERIMLRNPTQFPGPNHPMDSLSWIDGQEFCAKVGAKLPSAAQWVYACRAGTTGPFAGSGVLDDMGWYKKNSGNTPHPIGQKSPNSFGLYDMHGNLLEWCQDVYAEDFFVTLSPGARDPVNEAGGDEPRPRRVLMGGSFDGHEDYCRSADRYHEKQDFRWRGFGLRPVRDVAQPN